MLMPTDHGWEMLDGGDGCGWNRWIVLCRDSTGLIAYRLYRQGSRLDDSSVAIFKPRAAHQIHISLHNSM